jgi:1,4-alpha-glucan branching enzyme
MVAADFDAYAQAQREVDDLWNDKTRLVREDHPQHRPHGLVLVGSHDPAVCQGNLESWMKTPKAAPEAKLAWEISADEIAAILAGAHANPFAVLGVHKSGSVTLPAASSPAPNSKSPPCRSTARSIGELKPQHPDGFFAGTVSVNKQVPVRYRARRGDANGPSPTPTASAPVLGPMDDYYAREGSHLRLFDKMGAHWIKHEGAQGIHFAVWAPNAQRVSVVGDFNNWDGRRHVMRLRAGAGIWEIFAPDVPTGVAYKFEIIGQNGVLLPLKADPFARRSELRPKTASVATSELIQEWEDEAHLKHWSETDKRRQPISIYEVHAGSWQRRDDGTFLSWDEWPTD